MTIHANRNGTQAIGVEVSISRHKMKSRRERNDNLTGALLASLPVVSFLVQYVLSLHTGTLHLMFRHLTVMVVDWVFVPFNFFAIQVIDWRRGGRLYVIACISIVLNVLTHAYWQYNGLDLGHMITPAGIVLPAGWVHLVYSTMQMVLLVAFVFCRKPDPTGVRIATTFATLYFVTMGICGYVMHHGFILSDVVVSMTGLLFVLIYPTMRGHKG
jgi:hypothetical protein